MFFSEKIAEIIKSWEYDEIVTSEIKNTPNIPNFQYFKLFDNSGTRSEILIELDTNGYFIFHIGFNKSGRILRNGILNTDNYNYYTFKTEQEFLEQIEVIFNSHPYLVGRRRKKRLDEII